MSRIAVAIALLLALTATACGSNDPETSWGGDLELLAEQLAERHINAFHTIDEGTFTARVDDLAAEADSWTTEQGFFELSRLVARIGDAHTYVVPFQTLERYPVFVIPLADGLLVQATTQADADLLGGELLAVDGIPVDDLVEAGGEFVAADFVAARAGGVIEFINVPSFIEATGLERPAPGTVTVRTDDGDIVRDVTASATAFVDVDQDPDRPRLLVEDEPDAWYWTRDLPNANAIYMNYRRAREADDLSMAEMAKIITDGADAAGYDRLIIDLRQNRGGNSSVINPLLDALADHPLGEQVYVLIGSATFSSAVLNAVSLRDDLDATLVGWPTRQAVSAYGEVQVLTLPHSQLIVSYSTKYFDLGETGPLMPDIEVELTMDDFRNGTDRILEAAARHNR